MRTDGLEEALTLRILQDNREAIKDMARQNPSCAILVSNVTDDPLMSAYSEKSLASRFPNCVNMPRACSMLQTAAYTQSPELRGTV